MSTALERLAFRAKWRRRWQTYKKWILLSFLLVVIGILVLMAQAPRVYDWIIEEVKKRPENEPLPSWAPEYMYKLGYFLEITLREEEAKKCYRTLLDWYYDGEKLGIQDGIPLTKEFIIFPDEFDNVAIEEGCPWVGYAVFRLAELLFKNRKQQAHYMRLLYLHDWCETEGSDPAFDQRCKTLEALYRGGG